MARRDDLLELLRPPAHRGPLIAAGAVVFSAGIALEEVRLEDPLPRVFHVFILACAAALIYGLGVQARAENGRPPAYQSVLLVCGLLLLEGFLVQLARLLGAGFDAFPAGAFVWTSVLLCAAALYPAVLRTSALRDDRRDRARGRRAVGCQLGLRRRLAVGLPLAAAGA